MAFIPSLKDIHMLLHPPHSFSPPFFSLFLHTHYLLLLLLPLDAMKDTIRCCISCILPCGSLDVIRIVHVNGRVEEITHSISAAEVMKLYPKHVLRRPPSVPGEDSGTVPPNAELQRGKIYFLTPVSVRQEKPKRMRRKRREVVSQGVTSDRPSLLMSNQYLLEILSEKASTHRDSRRGRVGIWRPHLESISEVSTDP